MIHAYLCHSPKCLPIGRGLGRTCAEHGDKVTCDGEEGPRTFPDGRHYPRPVFSLRSWVLPSVMYYEKTKCLQRQGRSRCTRKTELRALSLWHGPRVRERGRKEWRGRKRTPPEIFAISPISPPSLSLSADGNGARRSTGEDAAAASLGSGEASPLVSLSLYPLSWLPPLHPTQCRSLGRISDVADPEAMSRRDSNEGGPTQARSTPPSLLRDPARWAPVPSHASPWCCGHAGGTWRPWRKKTGSGRSITWRHHESTTPARSVFSVPIQQLSIWPYTWGKSSSA
jgi:hypothetical protein